MLVLSRHNDEAVVLEIPAGLPAGTLIHVTPVSIRGDKVRLGFTAPTAISIHRQEVFERIQEERKASDSPVLPAA